VSGWEDLEFDVEGGPSGDALPASVAVDLYSQRLRDAIESVLTERDEVQWLPARAPDQPGGSPRRRWLLQPLSGADAISTTQSTYAPDFMREAAADLVTLMKPVFRREAVEGLRILKYPTGYRPIVSKEVREAVESAGCAGLEFIQVTVA
jgi:hypothetical protein